MKYLRVRLIIAKHILLSIAAFGHRLKFIASIFQDSLPWLLILSRLFSRKYNSLSSFFSKTKILMKFAINEKYSYVTITEL